MALSFHSRVALVTGAGGGLGRIYALMFASRGAMVVVNDLGGDRHGGGGSSRAADIVVDEIRKNGGKAVANYDSVENGDAIIKTAIDNFGRIDVVVNNAGILRDKSFVNMNEQDWDLIHKVHMKGAFMVSKAAWPYMRQQKFGRIIMISSNAGVFGNFGQANYSAAKMGVIGLAKTLALEGAKYNILSNVVIPTAASRLTEDVMPSEILNALQPEYVAPLVLYLSHDRCSDSGQVFEAGAGWFGKYRWQRSGGVALPQRPLNVDHLAERWDDVGNFDASTSTPASIQDATRFLVAVLNDAPAAQSPSAGAEHKRGLQSLVGYRFPTNTFQYGFNEAALYALSVGCSPHRAADMRFVYEAAGSGFQVLPTFGVIPAQSVLSALLSGSVPGAAELDLLKLLHGEQFIELHGVLPEAATLVTEATIVDVADKGSGALIVIDTVTSDKATGRSLCRNQFALFFVGKGGFGGSKKSDKLVPLEPTPSDRQPDQVVEEKTSLNQAGLYRLNGDRNPLHIDPEFAKMAGFERPILHGLCSLGISVRHIIGAFGNNDATSIKSVKVRFAKPVLPGQALRTRMWRQAERVHFETVVVETGQVCISGGTARLRAGDSPSKL